MQVTQSQVRGGVTRFAPRVIATERQKVVAEDEAANKVAISL